MSTTDLKSIRDLLKARDTNPDMAGTAEVDIVLDVSLAQALGEAVRAVADANMARANAETAASGKPTHAGKAKPDTTAEDQAITDAEKALEEAKADAYHATLYLKLRAIPARRYQQISAKYPDRGDKTADEIEQREQFFDELVDACLVSAHLGDEMQEITWSEIAEDLTDGEKEPVQVTAQNLNRRKVDIPFSLKGSGQTR